MKSKWSPVAVVCGALLLAACGQKGPLYMPEQATQIITRPAQTPDGQKPAGQSTPDSPPSQPPPSQGDAPNTPQTVDQPPGPDNPAPEVTAPDKNEKEPGAPAPR